MSEKPLESQAETKVTLSEKELAQKIEQAKVEGANLMSKTLREILGQQLTKIQSAEELIKIRPQLTKELQETISEGKQKIAEVLNQLDQPVTQIVFDKSKQGGEGFLDLGASTKPFPKDPN